MERRHQYETVVTWTGNRGTGTSGYRDYGREHVVQAEGPLPIEASSDPAFRGDHGRWNPELLLVAALSECHLLWYLHLCAEAGIVVTGYTDRPVGVMTDTGDSGRFTEVVLRPEVRVADAGMIDRAVALHDGAHRACFIANSVNFPVRHDPVVVGCRRVTPRAGPSWSATWLRRVPGRTRIAR
jgi:organic hydroperoxide reductase OsmC/OhrA